MRRLAALAIVALGIVTACSGDADSTPATSATTTTIATVPATVPATEPAIAPPTASAATEPTTATPEGAARDLVGAPEASTVDALLALDRPIVIAHAGGDFDAPHSTPYAYTEAALAGADVLELDVMLTADRVLVVQHDDTVDRTTPATGRVRDLTFEQLHALDNAHWFSGGVWVDQSLPDDAYVWRGVRTGDRPPPPGYAPDDFAVPTFRGVAEAFPEHVLDVEVKIPRGDDGEPDVAWAIEGARVLAEEIAALDRTDSVVVVSFDDDVLAAFRGFAPEVATSPGLDTLVAWYAGQAPTLASQDVVFQAPPFYGGVEVLTAETVERARADGFGVWVWMDDTATQENAEFYGALLDRGVDGLLVSRPATAVEVVRG